MRESVRETNLHVWYDGRYEPSFRQSRTCVTFFILSFLSLSRIRALVYAASVMPSREAEYSGRGVAFVDNKGRGFRALRQ